MRAMPRSAFAPLALGLALSATALLPARAAAAASTPELRKALGARIQGSEQGQAVLARALVSSLRARADMVLDAQWTPVFTANLMRNKDIKRLLARAKKKSQTPSDPELASAADLAPEVQAQIAQRRAALHAPLAELETALIARLTAHSQGMAAINQRLLAPNQEALPTALSQSALPPPTQFTQLLHRADAALQALSDSSRNNPQVLEQWSDFVATYQGKISALSTQLQGG